MVTTTRRLFNKAEVERAYSLLFEPGQVVEVRALKASLSSGSTGYTATYGGYFNNVESLVNALAQIRKAKGVYVTLQRCKPDLIHRTYNELVKQEQGGSTSDKDITGYRWLLIDSDPERSVSDISATGFEHANALSHSTLIAEALNALGWPAPIKADSGNGGHLHYRIDLETADSDLVKRVLEGLAQRFNQDDVHVDCTVYNPARICKLYGTLVCKGANTPERPHRMSRLLDIPAKIEVVGRELLEAIAIPHPEQPVPSSLPTGFKESISMESFLQTYHIDTYPPQPYAGGMRWKLKTCVWDSSHTDNSACVYQFADGRLAASCSHNSCKGKGWKDLRVVFEPDAYTRKEHAHAKPKKEEKVEDDAAPAPEKVKEPSAQTRLMQIAKQAHFINTASGALYARVPVNGHHEVVSINEKGSGFRRWLVYKFHAEYGFVPNSDALSQTMQGIQAKAEYEGERAKVHTRIAEKDGRVYLDLANEKWECVEISQDGWKVISCPPVYFRRPSGMLPLPIPQRGGDLRDLHKLIHASSEKDYILITSWLVGALHPTGPYPVLNLNGERGSAKSKTTTLLRNLIDPNEAPTRNAPKDDRDAAVAAQNNMVIALDNLSSMPLWLSDVLCRIATGSGFATREMYSDDSERVFSSKRPIILNGIEDGLITQGDLLNRTMLVTLEPPPIYRSEEEIDDLFREAHPRLLGSLLSIASHALRNRKKVQLENPPRMADFARWMTAAEPALKWKSGDFMTAYRENQDNSSSIIVESSPVAKAIMQFMKNHTDGWDGYIADLHEELKKYEVYEKAKYAPKAPNKLSGQLRRIAPSLRIQGIDIRLAGHEKKGSRVSLVTMGDDRLPLVTIGDDKKSSIVTDLEPELEPIYQGDIEKVTIGDDSYAYLSDTLSSGLVLKKEENSIKPDRVGKVSSPSSPTTETKAQFRQLYNELGEALQGRQAREKIAPLGTIHFGGMSSGLEPAIIPVSKVMKRLQEIYHSQDEKQIDYALDKMHNLLERIK